MDSASFQFVAFGLAVALISNFSRSRAWRSTVLMVASLVFLALLARQPIVFLPLAGLICVVWPTPSATREFRITPTKWLT